MIRCTARKYIWSYDAIYPTVYTSLVSRKTTKNETFLFNFARVCIDAQDMKTAVTWFQTHHMSWQTMTSQSSIASSGLLISCQRSNSSCLILSNFWQSQTKPWISSIWVWETFSTTKKMFRKEKIPLSVDFSKGYFQIRSGKNETKHKLISNASICWIIPRTFSLRQLLKFPFVKTIIQSRLDFSFINRRTKEYFRTILEPSRTHTGFRVSLVNFVEFVALHVYGKNSISGLRFDIHGDAMTWRKRDVVRMAFRMLDTGIETEQYSTQVITLLFSTKVFGVCVVSFAFWLDLQCETIWTFAYWPDLPYGLCFVFILLTGMIFQKAYVSLILITGMILYVVYVFIGERCTSRFGICPDYGERIRTQWEP